MSGPSAGFHGSTAPALLAERARRHPEAVAFRSKALGLYRERTWSEYGESVARCALGFQGLGLRRGDRVAIMADPCEEWLFCDLAAQSLGAIPYGIYPTAPSGDIEHLLRDGGATYFVAQTQEFVDKVLPLAQRLPELKAIVVVDTAAMFAFEDDRLVGFDWVLAEGEKRLRESGETGVGALETWSGDLDPLATAFLLYTPGTTGAPKGVAVSHRASLAAATTFVAHYPALARRHHRTVAHLPPAHPLGRHGAITLPLVTDLVPHFGEAGEDFTRTLFDVAPTVLVTVPRYLERLAAQVLAGVAGTGSIKRWAYETATAVGQRFVSSRWEQSTKLGDRLPHGLLRRLVLRPLLNKLGLDQAELVIAGGGPLPPEIGALWQTYGVNVVEIYAPTETAGAPVAGQPDFFPRPGNVGTVGSSWEVKLDAAGQVLVRGPAQSQGYWQSGGGLAEAAGEEGWLATGDLGEWSEGSLRILGRATDITTSPGGNRISPLPVELALRGHPYVADAVAFGGQGGELLALVGIDYDTVAEWARGRGVPFSGYESLARCTETASLVQDVVDGVNARLPAAERIRAFRILPDALDPTEEGGPVTPTRTIRREVIAARFRGLLESMSVAAAPNLSSNP